MSDGASHGYRESHPLPIQTAFPAKGTGAEAAALMSGEQKLRELHQTIHDLRQKNAQLQEQLREERDDWRDEVAASQMRMWRGLCKDAPAVGLAGRAYDDADALLAEGKRRREGEGNPMERLVQAAVKTGTGVMFTDRPGKVYDATDLWPEEDSSEGEGRPQPILQSLYTELLYEVDTKIPGETRHETARRWLRERRERPAQAGIPEVKP